MFKKILVANRGEIACRIARTARRMGITVVAVYSEADRWALHKDLADEAWLIGPGPAEQSYLDAEKIIAAARASGAEAIHPGYGFLSESAAFSERCRTAGVVFIGASPETMRMVGGKSAAKQLARKIGVPILPGYEGEEQSLEAFTAAADRIGYPVVVKASAGGGGRGMRVASRASHLEGAIESARREAIAAFGDGHLLLEKYLEGPRHLEIQILADAHGEILAFPERDCSLQRNHQKVIEETPAPRLTPPLAEALRDAARAIARASSYVGAGTVEFLLAGESFYFLEVNARLQVEHPVTEMVSGLDLVEMQLRVASGERLQMDEGELRARGCAIEARLCAEDPDQNFRPSFGEISHLRLPGQGPDTRIETGVRAGDAVSTHYDSLLVKLIVWDERREGAVRKMQRTLSQTALVGVASNLGFLGKLTSNAHFVSGEYDTLLAEQLARTPSAPPPSASLIYAAAAAVRMDDIRRMEKEAAAKTGGAPSPWSTADGWRLYDDRRMSLSIRYADGVLHGDLVRIEGDRFDMEMNRASTSVRARRFGDELRLCVDRLEKRIGVVASAGGCILIVDGRNFPVEWIDPLCASGQPRAEEASLRASLPARVVRVLVEPGDRVEKGQILLLLEAMKMEIPILAPRDGSIEGVFFSEGESVREGDEVIFMAETQ